MSAHVVAYSAHPEDLRLSVMVECLECEIEFGWTQDAPGTYDRLAILAERHNDRHHPDGKDDTE